MTRAEIAQTSRPPDARFFARIDGGRMCARSDSATVQIGTSLARNGSMQTPLYEVWCSSGHGIHVGPRFKLLRDAIRYVATHAAEASHAVRAPNGAWELIEPRHTPV